LEEIMSKHPPSGHTPTTLPADDLECDPGIGQSKGTTMSGEDPRELAGENTFEGDVDNETTRSGGVDPEHRGRSNA
jgi:hypothetical protein